MEKDLKEIEIIITTIRRVLDKKNIKLDEDIYTLDGRQFIAIENLYYAFQDMKAPVNDVINFAVCCSPSLNCDEHCTYSDEECTCGKMNEDFELAKDVKKLREIFPIKEEK
jgi:hypothetical protein